MQIVAGPVWKPDEDAPTCHACGVEFGVFTRRHHCRGCGDIFCAECSDFFRAFPQHGHPEAGPCCFACYLREGEIQEGQKAMLLNPKDSSALPVLVLGGALSGMTSLKPWAARLAEETKRPLVLVELPGLGARFKEGDLTSDGAVAAVREAVEAGGWPKVHIFGYSMGGCLATKFAIMHPDRVASLTIGGASYVGGETLLRMVGLGYKIMTRRMTWATMTSFFAVGTPDCAFSPGEWEHFCKTPLFFSRWPQCVDVMAQPEGQPTFVLDGLRALRAKGVPVLLLNGSKDKAQSMQKEFQEAAGAEVHVCEGAKHEGVCTLARLAEVAGVLGEFWNKNSP